jgi:hypothetical protein
MTHHMNGSGRVARFPISAWAFNRRNQVQLEADKRSRTFAWMWPAGLMPLPCRRAWRRYAIAHAAARGLPPPEAIDWPSLWVDFVNDHLAHTPEFREALPGALYPFEWAELCRPVVIRRRPPAAQPRPPEPERQAPPPARGRETPRRLAIELALTSIAAAVGLVVARSVEWSRPPELLVGAFCVAALVCGVLLVWWRHD